jgi:hypothetical protein
MKLEKTECSQVLEREAEVCLNDMTASSTTLAPTPFSGINP